MTLVLEIEYLSGVAFAARGPESGVPDWPPQPDRVFSALVAAWAARGARDDERAALLWLERQEPPRIVAEAAYERDSVNSFVPPNDQTESKTPKEYIRILPERRPRQPRRFPAARPHDPRVLLLWSRTDAPADVFDALCAIARDVAYIGHSASLTRCLFLAAEEADDKAVPARLGIYPGRLDELIADFAAQRRPSAGRRLSPTPSPAMPAACSHFGADWLVLEHVDADGTAMPDTRAVAIVARVLRDTILKAYGDKPIPEYISGHGADGRPSRNPHLAIIPLTFVGHPHADGHVLGFALVPPRGVDLLDDPEFHAVMRGCLSAPTQQGRRLIDLRPAAIGEAGRHGNVDFQVLLAPTFDPGRASLDPEPYCRPSRRFATVTPIVLDRHLKQSGEARDGELIELIKAACRNIGLPDPETVVVGKHSAVAGAVSAYPSGNAPAWMNWRLPGALQGRMLTHAMITFSEAVAGPVILGAGRFFGLGLARSVPMAEDAT
ncbi:MAG: type I-U CRISPR-associated protein Cas5/Cas6 [Hyphomicrobiaceae bacterium]|nr:type I-U CRISPR-associated protein Cas5/Cas6 [Hyphomicrobiaceae bacterium]